MFHTICNNQITIWIVQGDRKRSSYCFFRTVVELKTKQLKFDHSRRTEFNVFIKKKFKHVYISSTLFRKSIFDFSLNLRWNPVYFLIKLFSFYMYV